MNIKRNMICIFVLTIILSGCSIFEGKSDSKLNENQKYTLKVMYWNKQYFLQKYGNLFQAKFPNVELQVVSTDSIRQAGKNPNDELIKLIEQEKPDVLLLNYDQYKLLSDQARLYNLETSLSQDEYDISTINQKVIDLLRDNSQSALFGIAPTFSSQVIYYNRDLFDQYGIEYPVDQMTWEEVLHLAMRFPSDDLQEEDRIYGFAREFEHDSYSLIEQMASVQGLVPSQDGNLHIDSESWQDIFETAVDALRSNSIYYPNDDQGQTMFENNEDYLKSNMFLTGKSAMTLSDYTLIGNIKDASNVLKNTKPVNWDIVTSPVDALARDTNYGFTIREIFSIDRDSSNILPAVEFIKFIGSEEIAKMLSNSIGELPSRSEYSLEYEGRKLDSFYKLNSRNTSQSGLDQNQIAFNSAFRTIVNEELRKVIVNDFSFEEAMLLIRQRGQNTLLNAE
ncbi:ABC transporter substrate-binding protein [Paenibacillus harenae]|uniref:Multiple sugar transport system substrate-binding protein n=1 Tax=Paenibacillus harenae TaxID=306543 RepID=A0ABT9U9T0_PAEHA|nr:ABC transporter substrate-binding protein [Paenibacillus harenae]MDQ0116343.1 multiple sugar transport system substrate-binding protein [Paenibacillus harenae]